MPLKIDPTSLPDTPHLRHEAALWTNGALWVAGIDEAGRGALAGPVAAAAVVLPQTPGLKKDLAGVRDSKEMTPAARETWSHVIREIAVTCAVGTASAKEIDALGIVPATRLASSRALDGLDVCPDCLLLDYLNLPDVILTQISLIKGDMRSLSIAAASVLAKTARDAILIEMDESYPGYGFAAHKGYGTASHCEAIQNLGPSPVHRFSFAPIRDLQLDILQSSIFSKCQFDV
jgi:ribonuclease HII